MPVTIDMTALDKLRTLGAEGVKAMQTAIDRTARKGRSIIIEEAAAAYKVKPEVMSKAIRIAKSAEPLAAEIRIRGNRLPMYAFAPQPNMPFMGGRREPGVSVDIKSRRMVRQAFKHPGQYAFIARMASGHVGVFERSGAFGRVPKRGLVKTTGTGFKINVGRTAKLERIQEMFTLAPPQMLSSTVYPKVQARLQEQLKIEAEKEYKKAVTAIFKAAYAV